MAFHRSQNARRPQVARIDELPQGRAAEYRLGEPAVKRDALGRPADAESARLMGSHGGARSKGSTRLGSRLSLGEGFADPRFEPYARAARHFRKAQVARLAQLVGGGTCGPAPSSLVASASLQLAGSRFAAEVLGDLSLASKLANDSRSNLIAAHEICALETKASPKTHATKTDFVRAAILAADPTKKDTTS